MCGYCKLSRAIRKLLRGVVLESIGNDEAVKVEVAIGIRSRSIRKSCIKLTETDWV